MGKLELRARMTHIGEALNKLFIEFADQHAVTVNGEPSPELTIVWPTESSNSFRADAHRNAEPEVWVIVWPAMQNRTTRWPTRVESVFQRIIEREWTRFS